MLFRSTTFARAISGKKSRAARAALLLPPYSAEKNSFICFARATGGEKVVLHVPHAF